MTKESGGFDQIDQWKSTMFLYKMCIRDRNRPGHVQNVLLYCPIHDTSVILNEVSRLVFMIMGAMAGVSIVLFCFVAGSISTPVSRLCEAARGIGEKKFKKVETGTNVKELYELENEINQMQDLSLIHIYSPSSTSQCFQPIFLHGQSCHGGRCDGRSQGEERWRTG